MKNDGLRLIDADKLIDSFEEWAQQTNPGPQNNDFSLGYFQCASAYETIKTAIETIKKAPVIDFVAVENGVKLGAYVNLFTKAPEWINLTPPEWRDEFRKRGKDTRFMCSKCKRAVVFVSQELPYPRCPHCGARMEV